MISTFIAIAALMAFVFIGPPISRGGTAARNSGFGVRLPYADVTLRDGQSLRGRKAHEVSEFRLGWLIGAIVSLWTFILPDPFAGVAYLASAAVVQSLARAITGHFDYIGHNVEIMVAEEEGMEGYRQAEIRRMIDRDASRRGMSEAAVNARLRKWAWLARIMRRMV